MGQGDESHGGPHRVVIIGGGFGGLYAAKALKKAPVSVSLVDKRNFHLFQPLLYQVATGGLSPGDISSPIRSVLKSQKNTQIILSEAIDVDPGSRNVMLVDGKIRYDSLIIATGMGQSYFGHDDWSGHAPGLKTIENALELRSRILLAFEAAEREPDPERRQACQTFVIIGGGPTGVELAGALGELAANTLRKDFRNIDTLDTRIILVEAGERILQSFPSKLSVSAEKTLRRLGVTIEKNAMVTDIQSDRVIVGKSDDSSMTIRSRTILWAAGIQASDFAKKLAQRTGAETDRMGRFYVQADLSLENNPEIVIIGDLANYSRHSGSAPPGMAPVAMQQGRYAARLIKNRLTGKTTPPFEYINKGSLAVIGRNAAVADFGFIRFHGFPAWVIWIFVHIAYLIEYDNRLLVLFQWAWNYFTRKRGARLVTGDDPWPLVVQKERAPSEIQKK